MTARDPRYQSFATWIVGLLVLSLILLAAGSAGHSDSNAKTLHGLNLHPPSSSSVAASGSSVAASGSSVAASGSAPSDGVYEVTVRRPAGPPSIQVGEPDPQGRVGSVACATCHSVRDPNLNIQSAADLKQFHQNMPFSHGTVTCYGCHNVDDMDTLRLADSKPVEFVDVMTLCGQ